jgi:phage-related protein
MIKYFDVIFSDHAKSFLDELDSAARNKILYNIDKARFVSDPRIFKKIDQNIWEFRTRFNSVQYRLLAFWDKSDANQTMVIASNGVVKKSKKLPVSEMKRAMQIRDQYINLNYEK